MNNIQTDLSDQALITAIRANLCEFFRHLNRSFPETCFENTKFACWCASIEHPWFNGVLSSQPPEKEDKKFIEEKESVRSPGGWTPQFRVRTGSLSWRNMVSNTLTTLPAWQ